MTYQGRLLSVNRFGMGKHDNGVLAKSSFEETSKILFNAAVAAEFDPMKGVSANIMFGQKPPCGTRLRGHSAGRDASTRRQLRKRRS